MRNNARLDSQHQLDNQFQGLIQQRQLIQQTNQNQFKTLGNPQYPFSNRNYHADVHPASRITGHEYSIIDQIEKRIISQIEQERSQNREIKAKINQLQSKRQQERKKTLLLQQELQRLTGINYSQNIPPINYTFKPTPFHPQINVSSPQITPTQINALREQINILNMENSKIKQAKSTDSNQVMLLKQKVAAAQQKAQEYLNLRQAYRAKLANKSDNDPQIISLLQKAEEIRGQGSRLINKKISQLNS